jgi:protein CpxP
MALALGRLNLTDAQKDQVKAIMDSHQEEMKALGDRLRTAHEALEAAVTADRLDENEIRAKSAALAEVEADQAVMQARVRNEVFQVLTAQQKELAKQFASNRRAFPDRGGRGRGRP